MIIQSTRLGELDVTDTNIITFPEGILGFPDEHAFVLISQTPDSPFVLLQSTSEPNLTFIALETLSISDKYEFTLSDEIVQELHLSADNLPQVYNIVTTGTTAEDMTVNLLAPIIVDTTQRQAKQTVLENVPYTIRHRIFSEGAMQMVQESS